MNIKDFVKSQTFKGILIGLVLAVLVLIVFQAGVAVGERRSNFAHRFGDNFERNFRGPEGRMMLRMPGKDMAPGGHGAAGEIISVALPQIVVAGPDHLEKTILIGDDTIIRQFRNELTAKDLKTGDFIVSLGTPTDDGQIKARLIRLMPPPVTNQPTVNQPAANQSQ